MRIGARNMAFKIYRASVRNLAPQRVQIKIDDVHLNSSKCKKENSFNMATRRNNDRKKLRTVCIALFYYINWKGWRTCGI